MAARLFFTLFIFLGFNSLRSQGEYKGIMIDATTNAPIPYVNIGIVNKGIGTVSDEEGKFLLTLEPRKYNANDILQFSSLGYFTVKKAIIDLKLNLDEYPKVAMRPESIVLDEVFLSNKGPLRQYKKEKVGHHNSGESVYGYWKDNIALGGELGTRIKVKKGVRRLKDFSFKVVENLSDSIRIRINIYNSQNKQPGKKLVNGNILYTLKRKSGQVRIDLEPFKILVEDDFVISLELLKVYGGDIGLVLLGTNDNGVSYSRYASQDSWKTIKSSMAFLLNTTLLKPIDVKEAEINSAPKDRSISGMAFHYGKPMPNVTVTNRTTNHTTMTDMKGRYEIEAELGDVIFYTAKDMQPVEKRTMEKPTMNVSMQLKIDQ